MSPSRSRRHHHRRRVVGLAGSGMSRRTRTPSGLKRSARLEAQPPVRSESDPRRGRASCFSRPATALGGVCRARVGCFDQALWFAGVFLDNRELAVSLDNRLRLGVFVAEHDQEAVGISSNVNVKRCLNREGNDAGTGSTLACDRELWEALSASARPVDLLVEAANAASLSAICARRNRCSEPCLGIPAVSHREGVSKRNFDPRSGRGQTRASRAAASGLTRRSGARVRDPDSEGR